MVEKQFGTEPIEINKRSTNHLSDMLVNRMKNRAGIIVLILILLSILVIPAGSTTITFSDNNLIQGYSIDIYTVGNLSGSLNTSLVSRWNNSVVTPISLDPNGSYIGIIRQNQVARFNNINSLVTDLLNYFEANYVGLILVIIALGVLIGMGRRR
jgi:hypothetical protein